MLDTRRRKKFQPATSLSVIAISAFLALSCNDSGKNNAAIPAPATGSPPPGSGAEVHAALADRDFQRAHTLARELAQNDPGNADLPALLRQLGLHFARDATPETTVAELDRARWCFDQLEKRGAGDLESARTRVRLEFCATWHDPAAADRVLTLADKLFAQRNPATPPEGSPADRDLADLRGQAAASGYPAALLDGGFTPEARAVDLDYLNACRLLFAEARSAAPLTGRELDVARLFHSLARSIAVDTTEATETSQTPRTPLRVLIEGRATVEELAVLFQRMLVVAAPSPQHPQGKLSVVSCQLSAGGPTSPVGPTSQQPAPSLPSLAPRPQPRIVAVEVGTAAAAGTDASSAPAIIYDIAAGAALCSLSQRAPRTPMAAVIKELEAGAESPLTAGGRMPTVTAEDVRSGRRLVAPHPLALTGRFRFLTQLLGGGKPGDFPLLDWPASSVATTQGEPDGRTSALAPGALRADAAVAAGLGDERPARAEFFRARLAELGGAGGAAEYRAILARHAGSLTPDDEAMVRTRLVISLLRQGREPQAERELRAALDRGAPQPWANLLWYHQGVLARRAGRKAEAAGHFAKVVGPFAYRAALAADGRVDAE
ncbi:MAG: tetratricopeptide repeat protein [Planctomycetes bacterium]|nr:tetratricopeptide repeat protein [Planctomycetota bacterium]